MYSGGLRHKYEHSCMHGLNLCDEIHFAMLHPEGIAEAVLVKKQNDTLLIY